MANRGQPDGEAIASDGRPIAQITQKWLTVRDSYTVDYLTSLDPGLVMSVIWAIDRWVERDQTEVRPRVGVGSQSCGPRSPATQKAGDLGWLRPIRRLSEALRWGLTNSENQLFCGRATSRGAFSPYGDLTPGCVF